MHRSFSTFLMEAAMLQNMRMCTINPFFGISHVDATTVWLITAINW